MIFLCICADGSQRGRLCGKCICLTWDGMKKTIPGVSPRWILADTEILPGRRSADSSGVSDLLGKYTAILDWRVSHLVTGEYICEDICELLERAIKDVDRELEDIRNGEWDAVEKLMYALVLSGLAMQMAGSPRPVSGAEHMAAHFWDMKDPKGDRGTSPD